MEIENSQPGPRALDRRGSVWSACDQLAAEGVKPTLSKVRPIHRGGSDTDVQADIQAWFAQLFKRHSDQAEGLGMPKEVAALMRALWEAAQGSADAMLQAQREELVKIREACERDAERANAERDEAVERANALDRSLAAEVEKSAGLARSLADVEIRLAEALSEARQERARADRSASELSAMETRHSEAMWQLREEAGDQMHELRQAHAQELSIERAARTEEVMGLREQLRQRGEHYDQEVRLAEERLRAVEKRLMMEQDAVRHSAAEWKRKAQEEREAGEAKLAMVRRQMEGLVGEAAGLRARLESSEASAAEAKEDAAKSRADLANLAQAIAQGQAKPAEGSPGDGAQ